MERVKLYRSLFVFFFAFLTCIPNYAKAFPVLFGDDYSITVQFQGEGSQTIAAKSPWGTGDTYPGFTCTADVDILIPLYEPLMKSIAWKTWSSSAESGLRFDPFFGSHAAIWAYVQHKTANYADFTISGLDGWKDYPSLDQFFNYQIDLDSIKTDAYAVVTNVAVDGTYLKFRVNLSDHEGFGFKYNEARLGFRGEVIPEPATLLLLGLGGLLIRRK